MLNQNPSEQDFTWHNKAACKDLSADVFFPLNYNSSSLEQAKQICSSCPVKVQCFQDAISNNVYGIWAGTTEYQRRNIVNNYYNGEYKVISLKEAKYILNSIIKS